VRTLIARIFDYSLDGVVATEGTSFFDFCRDLPDDEADLDRTRAFYENADLHIMGRKQYQNAAGYFPEAVDHPYAAAMNAARKVVFSHTITTADWANTSVVNGDLGAEIDTLKLDGDGYIVASRTWRARARGSSTTWRSQPGWNSSPARRLAAAVPS
jgi:dihydrofolate reductase